MIQRTKESGYLMVMTLVFAGIFFTILSSFVVFVVTQSRVIEQKIQLEQAGQIAEAGLNYYKWFLAHHPNDTTNGTGLPGPYVGVYNDPEGGPIGEYSLSISSTTYCGSVSTLEVSSTGHTYEAPGVKRTLTARYARPNVAEYSFILNSDVWAGPDRIINGPYHSNGGIRMDGRNNSSVTSGQATWSCTSSFGCSPTVNRNGVFTSTANANAALFEFPSPPVNFGGLTANLNEIQTRAQLGGGLFFPQATSGVLGYHVRFNSTNTITVRRVTSAPLYWGSTQEAGWVQEQHVIGTSTLLGTFTIPPSCPVIAFQNKLWIEGVIPRKVTISAFATSTSNNPSIILQGNITYTSATSSGLLAAAEQDVLVGLNVPDDMVLNGIFIAQNGRYGRNHYCTNCTDGGDNRGLPSSLDPFVIRNSETHNGTIVSNGRVGTQWTSSGSIISGFRNRNTSYDRNLVESPPPFIPNTSDDYEFSDWRDAN